MTKSPKLKTHLKSIQTFFARFKSHFSATQFVMLRNAVLALFLEFQRCSLEAMSHKIGCPYQNLQYFLSDSKWDPLEEINRTRLDILMQCRPTGPTKNGVCVIDDTGCPKPYAKKTEGAYWQHCPPLKREEVCHVSVFSGYADEGKHFPLDAIPYVPAKGFEFGKEDPRFQTKIQIAAELLRAIAAHPDLPKHVVLDSWYTSAELIEEGAKELQLTITGELKSNRNLLLDRPDTRRREYVTADKLVTLIRKHYSDKVTYVTRRMADGRTVKIPVYAFKSQLKDCGVPVKIVAVLGKLFEGDERSVHFLFSTDCKATAREIVDTYRLRWGIERVFAELKENFQYDQYQLRHLPRIRRFWLLCLIAWTLTYRLKMTGALKKVVALETNTFPEHARAVRKLIEYAYNRELSKSEHPEKVFRILSKRAALRGA